MFSLISLFLPVFIMIGIGYGLRVSHVIPENLWTPLEKLTYFVFFPALLIHNLATTDFSHIQASAMAGLLATTILVLTAFLLLLRPFLPYNGASFSSIVQGGLRFNSYLGMAMTVTIQPLAGLVYAAVAMIAMIPLLNIIAVLVLARFAHPTPLSGKALSWALITNPLIVGCAIGISLNYSGLQLPWFLSEVAKQLGSATLPIGLLTVGAALHFNTIHHNYGALLLAILIKLIIMPAIVWGGCYYFALSKETTLITVLFAALPTSTVSYLLAKQLGGDFRLMATIIAVQTVCAAFTIPLILSII